MSDRLPYGSFLKRYERTKSQLLNDSSICQENRQLFSHFLQEEEYKLKRKRSLRSLDESNAKTLYGYVKKFKNVNLWFNNKPLQDLTKHDIQQVYDDLEDGKIKTKRGKPFVGLNDSYYKKIFKSRPFELAGQLETAKAVIRYSGAEENSEVRFILEDGFRKIVECTYNPKHRALLWVLWDFGENISSILRLTKRDFSRQINPDTEEPEYLVNFRKEILKRSRISRSEYTLYPETVALLDELLPHLDPDGHVFPYPYMTAKLILSRAVKRSGVRCIPNGELVTFKDLRSGMSCDLLNKDWGTDDINARLGHAPGSRVLKKYINYLAIGRHRPKKKVHEFQVKRLNRELETVKQREKLQGQKAADLQNRLDMMEERMRKFEKAMELNALQST